MGRIIPYMKWKIIQSCLKPPTRLLLSLNIIVGYHYIFHSYNGHICYVPYLPVFFWNPSKYLQYVQHEPAGRPMNQPFLNCKMLVVFCDDFPTSTSTILCIIWVNVCIHMGYMYIYIWVIYIIYIFP